MTFVSWTIIIIAFLFIFDIPQKIYYAIMQHGNKLKEVKSDERDSYERDIDRDDD